MAKVVWCLEERMGAGVQRRSLFRWSSKRKSGAGKGLSRRGVEESAARFGPFPLSESILP